MDCTVIRSGRKTLCLQISRTGEVIVRAPLRIPDAEIAHFLERHRAWLEKRLGERHAAPTFSDGERIPVCGTLYRIRSGEKFRTEGDILYLPTQGREQALIRAFRSIAKKRMRSFLDTFCKRNAFGYRTLHITSARGRWGSCSTKGGISFSFRTSFLPDELAEYLALHELCHTVHMDHSAKFWEKVRSIMPDYAVRRKALKDYLWVMDAL